MMSVLTMAPTACASQICAFQSLSRDDERSDLDAPHDAIAIVVFQSLSRDDERSDGRSGCIPIRRRRVFQSLSRDDERSDFVCEYDLALGYSVPIPQSG